MQTFQNLDANETIFFERELEFIKRQTYDIKLPNLKATKLIPVSFDAGEGAQSITYQQYEKVGVAQIIASYANDLPRADVMGREFTSIIKSIGVSYGWNIQEIKSAMMAGKPLTARKAEAARRANDELVDSIAWWGDAEANLQGMLRHPNIPSGLAPDGAATNTQWSTKTADEILADLNAMVTNIIDLTSEVEAPDTILIPVTQYALITTTPRSSTSDTTILEFFLKNSAYVNDVQPLVQLNSVTPAIVGGGDSTDIAVAYKKSADILTLEIPLGFIQLSAQEKGLEFEVPCYSRCGGVIIYRPLSIYIMEGI